MVSHISPIKMWRDRNSTNGDNQKKKN